MLEITVKTLDGRNHKFSVPDDITVRQFKEAICNSIEIEADVQRLIFQGRVLADEKKINDYDVNGKTIHVVQRPPPSAKPQASADGGASASRDHHHDDRGGRPHQRETNSFVLGSFSLPADAADPNHVQNMVQQMLSGMGDLGRAHVTTQNSANGSVDVHINVTPNVQQSDAQNRLTQVSRMLTSAQQTLDKLENLATDDREVPMDTSADGPTSPQASGSTPRSGTSQSAPAGEEASTQDVTDQPNSLSQDPTVSNLSGLLEDILRFNENFAPHLSQFQQLMSSDPDLSGNAAEVHHKQQLCDLTSETLHYMGHVYHGLSDLAVDMSQTPPRHIRATPSVMPQATAVIQQTIPVQAQISVAHVPFGTASYASGGVPAAGTSPSASGGMPAAGTAPPAPGGMPAARTAPSASGGMPAARAAPSTSGGMPTTGTVPPASGGMPAAVAPSSGASVSGGTPVVGSSSSGSSISGSSTSESSTSASSTSESLTSESSASGTSVNVASAGGATQAHAESKGATPNTGASNTSTTNQPSIPSRAGDQTSTASRNTSSTNSGSFTGRMPSPWESALPQFRLGMSGAAMPLPRTPTALPAGFHMFVEMSEDGATAGAVPPQPDSSRTPTNQPGGTGAEAHLPEGGLPFPPGDFFQNIIQMAAGAALRGQPGQQVFVLSQGNMQPITVGPSAVNRQSGGAPSTAPMNGHPSSAGASTFTTNSAPAPNGTATGGSQGQGANLPRPGAFAGPRMSGIFAPPAGMGGLHLGGPLTGAPLPGIFDPFGLIPVIDPFLPCNSRHFIPRRMLIPNTANEAPQTSQPQSLAQHFVSNLVSSMMGPPVSTAAPGQPGRGSGPVPPLARVFVMPNMMAAASGMNRAGTEAQMGGRTEPAASDGSSSATGAGQTDEVISRLIRGISTQLTQAAFGQQANMSIADFLGSLGNEFNISQGEGLLTDLFNCVTQHLVFSDLMMIFFGQVAPIERLRLPLRNFVSTNVLNGQEPNDVSVEQAVNRLMANMEHDIEETAAVASSHDHIDYRASLTRFIRTHLMATIWLIVNATDNSGFSQSLYDRSRLVIHEFIALSRFCLKGGVGALDALIQNRLQVIASEVNPGMQMQMVQMAHQQLHQILPMVTLRDADIQQYVVPRDASCAAPVVGTSEASPQSTDSYETASGGIDVADEAPVESKPRQQLSSELSSLNSSAPLVRDHQSPNGFIGGSEGNLPRIGSELLSRLPPPPAQDDGNQVQVVIGSEEWHAEVPSDWVPVITRDVARQRRQAPQPSLSDAYLTGMPSKRRKVMSHERQREEFADVHVAIPEAIRRAAEQVDSRPVTSFSELSRDVAGSSQLQAAFQQEISEAIRRRIASDPDYNPNRFPNIEKFFDAKK